MKRTLVFLTVIFSLSLVYVSTVFSAQPVNPDKELIVSMPNEGGEFYNISSALASITDASASKPYIIKVMPGIYTESITMKSYVDLVGSGMENTKVTSSVTTAGGTVATVKGANNSSIENIWVENSGASNGRPVAILNDNTSMSIRYVKATTDTTGQTVTDAVGIRNLGSGATVDISHCLVFVSGDHGSLGIQTQNDSKVNISNCNIAVYSDGGNWNSGVSISNLGSGSGSSEVRIMYSTIKSTGSMYNYAADVETTGSMFISNSILESIGGTSDNSVIYAGSRAVTVTNSELKASGATTNCAISSGNNTKIGGSLIDGEMCQGGIPKIVHSWDGSFNPITNQ